MNIASNVKLSNYPGLVLFGMEKKGTLVTLLTLKISKTIGYHVKISCHTSKTNNHSYHVRFTWNTSKTWNQRCPVKLINNKLCSGGYYVETGLTSRGNSPFVLDSTLYKIIFFEEAPPVNG